MKNKFIIFTSAVLICSALLCSCGSVNHTGMKDTKDVKDTNERTTEKNSVSGGMKDTSDTKESGTDMLGMRELEAEKLETLKKSFYPGMEDGTLGALVEASFTNPHWYYAEDDDIGAERDKDSEYVIFEGDASKDGITNHVYAVFEIKSSGDLALHRCKINDAAAPESELLGLLVHEDMTEKAQ